MALIEFNDYPNTDTPINSETLNANFNDIISRIKNSDDSSEDNVFCCSYIKALLSHVVESGRNERGDYVKFSNGILICSSYFGPVDTQGGTGAQRIVQFPYNFLNNEYSCNVSIIGGQAYWADLSYCIYYKTANGFTLQTWNRGGSANIGQWFNYIAIGRWK